MAITGTMLGRSAATNGTVHVAGLRELLQGLAELPAELGKGAIYAALGGAARVVRDEARARAPVLQTPTRNRKPGTVRDAIRASRSKVNKGQNGLWEVIVRVKPLKGRQVAKFKKETGKAGNQNPNDPFYWWFLEFGTSKLAARPFLRPAFDTTKDAQLAAMRKRMKAGLAAAARKIEQQVKRAA
jgi:HK97 gp10 family phage protein